MLARSLALGFNSLSSVMATLKQQQRLGGQGVVGMAPPWRDSPLTRWLKGPLGTAGHVLFIATVAPGLEVTYSLCLPVLPPDDSVDTMTRPLHCVTIWLPRCPLVAWPPLPCTYLISVFFSLSL